MTDIKHRKETHTVVESTDPLEEHIADEMKWRDYVAKELRAHGLQIGELKTSLDSNTTVTTEVKDLLSTFKAGFRIAGWIQDTAVWVSKIAAAAIVMWAIFEYGVVAALKKMPRF